MKTKEKLKLKEYRYALQKNIQAFWKSGQKWSSATISHPRDVFSYKITPFWSPYWIVSFQLANLALNEAGIILTLTKIVFTEMPSLLVAYGGHISIHMSSASWERSLMDVSLLEKFSNIKRWNKFAWLWEFP